MRWGKLLNRTLFLPFVAAVILLIVLLFSQPGLRFSIWLTDKLFDELHIGQSEGAWLTGVTLRDIRYTQPDLSVTLDRVTLRLQKRCLIQFRLCIPELAIVGSRVLLADAHTSETLTVSDDAGNADLAVAPASAVNINTRILFPIPIRIDALQLDDTQLDLADQHVHWQRFQIRVVAWGNRLQLSQGRWHDIAITLPPEQTASTPTTGYYAPALPQFTLPLSIYLEDFQLTQLSFKQGDMRQTVDEFSLSAQVAAQQIRVLDARLIHEAAQAQLAAHITLSDNFPVSANLDVQLQQGELAGQRVQLHASGDLAQLALDVTMSGAVAATAQAELALLTDDLPLQVTLASDQLVWPLQDADYQLQHSRIHAHGNLSELQIQALTRFSGQNLPDTQLELAAVWRQWQQHLSLTNLALNTLGGTVTANGALTVTPAVAGELAIKIQHIQPALAWPEFPGVLDGEFTAQVTHSANHDLRVHLPVLKLAGRIRELPFNLAGALSIDGNTEQANWQLATPGLQLSHGQNVISVGGHVADTWKLDANVDLPDLAASHPALRGAVNGQLQLRGPIMTPDITLAMSAERLAYQEARLRRATLSAQLSLAQPITSQLDFSLEQARWQQQRIQELTLALSGTELAHELTLAINTGEISAALALSGALPDRQHWQGVFSEVTLQTPIGQWTLAAPLPLQADLIQQQLRIAKHCWQQAAATLCLTDDSTFSAETANMQIALADYPLSQLNNLLPLHSTLEGDLAVRANVNWHAGLPPEADITLQSQQGQVTQQLDVPVSLGWSTLSMQTTLAQQQLRSHLTTQLGTEGKLHAQLLVTELASAAKPLRAEIALEQLTLDFLRPLLDEYSELAGTLSSKLSLHGTLSKPEVLGEMRLDALKVKGKLAPTDIEQADLQVKFTGENAQLEGAVRTPEGLIALTGYANWQELDNWHAALNIRGDELKLQIPQAALYIKPDLQINATPGRSRISGSIDIPRADITVDSLPQNAVGLSSDHVLLNRRLEPISASPATTFALETDIRVRLGQRVRLSAFGLKTRLNGELRVQQQQVNPTVRGEVSLQDGTFRAYGQDLLIRQGKMTFSGPADQPFLNVEAIRNPANMEDDVIAGIRVSGPADEPVITIFSEPSKPQANALSYLIMGRDLDSESGSTANSVTTSLIGMSIASSGRLVGEIGEAFGVSDLTLDTEGAGDNSQVTVSGYLTRDLQLKYGIGIFQPIGQFTLRYRLMRSLFLEAVSGLDNAVDLLYKFEFD